MKGLKPVILAIAAATFLKLFVFDFVVAQGQSMEPAIHDGTVLVISRLRYGLRMPWQQGYLIRWSQPKEGDVVTFFTPEGNIAVKRSVLIIGDKFFAEGDNKLASYDSRAYGPVSINNIIGKVLGY
jgi:signal peptidase I